MAYQTIRQPKLNIGMQFSPDNDPRSIARVTDILEDHIYAIEWIDNKDKMKWLSRWDTRRLPDIIIVISCIEDGTITYA